MPRGGLLADQASAGGPTTPFSQKKTIATNPPRQPKPQVAKANTHAPRFAGPPHQSSTMPNSHVPINPPPKPIAEKIAIIAPALLSGKAVASRPEVRLEKLPCTMKPATRESSNAAVSGSVAANPNRPVANTDTTNTDIAVVRSPKRSASSFPRSPAGTPSRPISAAVIKTAQSCVAP